MSAPGDPRQARAFRFAGCEFDAARGEATLRYAFDNGSELIERIGFPDAPALPVERREAFRRCTASAALDRGRELLQGGRAGRDCCRR